MSTVSLETMEAEREPSWLADEPFQPPLEEQEPEDDGLDHSKCDHLGGDCKHYKDEYAQTQEAIEAAGDSGEDFGGDFGGEIELDESTLLHKARQLEEIQEAARESAKARTAYEAAKKTATARKADWEEAAERLERLCKASEESLPLFDRPKLADTIEVEIPAATGWEGVQLATIEGFPAKVAEKLSDEHGIFALGSLAAWTASNNKLTDLKGVGPAKAEAAENALEAFWQSWNEKYPPKAEAPNEGEIETVSFQRGSGRPTRLDGTGLARLTRGYASCEEKDSLATSKGV